MKAYESNVATSFFKYIHFLGVWYIDVTQTIDNNTTKKYMVHLEKWQGELAGMAMGTALSHLDRSLEMWSHSWCAWRSWGSWIYRSILPMKTTQNLWLIALCRAEDFASWEKVEMTYKDVETFHPSWVVLICDSGWMNSSSHEIAHDATSTMGWNSFFLFSCVDWVLVVHH